MVGMSNVCIDYTVHRLLDEIPQGLVSAVVCKRDLPVLTAVRVACMCAAKRCAVRRAAWPLAHSVQLSASILPRDWVFWRPGPLMLGQEALRSACGAVWWYAVALRRCLVCVAVIVDTCLVWSGSAERMSTQLLQVSCLCG
jgi:hypothetical protein